MRMREEGKNCALAILEEEPLLSTPEAIDWLKSKGVHTSRSGLDTARMRGSLRFLRVKGRVRILYRPSDLADAFLQEYVTHEAHAVKRGSRFSKEVGFLSQDEAFRRAVELASGG